MRITKCGAIAELVYSRHFKNDYQLKSVSSIHMHVQPHTPFVGVCTAINMSFLDIKDTAERATLVKEYGTAIKTVKQRNMMKREMKLAIGDELQTLFHPIVNATKLVAE